MLSIVDSPVQTQLAIPLPDGGFCTRRLVRRRIFVQTDTGSVLGIDLDGTDNVQTIKKKMQNMLNVPTEETALVFGDTILKADLSGLRNDAPLLLTRNLKRSVSTPCICPSPEPQTEAGQNQPLEVVGGLRCCSNMKRTIKELVKAIECGVEPIAVSGGLGGAYYFRNTRGETVAIMKPTDEEPFAPNNPKGFVGKALGQPGLKKAVRVGETAIREVAAYLLDHDHFAQVPPTVLVKVSHHVFNINCATHAHKGTAKDSCSLVAKLASCQQFVHHDFDASDHGSSRFSVSAVHRIGILDLRIFNTDRHGGNILVRNVSPLQSRSSWGTRASVQEAFELIPIDHGLCLPEALEDPYFEWLHWPQASVPFSDEELSYIQQLDEHKDADILRTELPMLREACLRLLILSTTALKAAAAAGLCLAEIGELMSRNGMEEVSQLELLCFQAKLQVEEEFATTLFISDDECPSEDEQFEFEMDDVSQLCLDTSSCGFEETDHIDAVGNNTDMNTCLLNSTNAMRRFGRRRLDFGPLMEDEEAAALKGSPTISPRIAPCKGDFPSPRAARARMSSCKRDSPSPRGKPHRSISFSHRKQRYWSLKDQNSFSVDSTIPMSGDVKSNDIAGKTSQVALGDMAEVEWMHFLECFKELLHDTLSQNRGPYRHRLGISCQF